MKPGTYLIHADVVRIIAVFGVVFIHVSDPFLVFPPYLTLRGLSFDVLFYLNVVCKICVPMFIVLSGYLLLKPEKTENINAFYNKRVKRLGIPLVFWISVYFAWLWYSGAELSLYKAAEMLATVNFDYLYFLFVIFELYFITPVLATFIAHTKQVGHRNLLLTALAFTAIVTANIYLFPESGINLQRGIVTIFMPFTVFYLAGFYIRKYAVTLPWAYGSWLIFAALSLVSWFLSDGNFDSYFRHYGSPVIMPMIFIAFILLMNSKTIDRLTAHKRVSSAIATVARCVFGIYLIHMLIINIIGEFSWWVPGNISSPVWLLVVIKSVVVYTLCFLVVFFGRKIPGVRHIFG